jgi:hypothetical protein
LQNQFAVVVAYPLWFPQFLRFSIGVFSKVNVSIGVKTCGMHGTDEVWLAAVEETVIALMDLGHGGALGLGLEFEFSFSQMGVLVAIAEP